MLPSSVSGNASGGWSAGAFYDEAGFTGGAVSPQPWETLHRYWVSKWVDGRPPGLRDIDPIIDIPRLVANLVLIDVRADGYWYRLIGSTNVERWGMDPTGKPVRDNGPLAKIKSIWSDVYDLVVCDQKPRMIVSRMSAGASAKHIILVMALTDESGKTNCLLIGVFYEGDFKRGTQIEDVVVHEVAS
jgi:hypothetical protein